MTILVADRIADVGVRRLDDAGHAVYVEPALTGDALTARLAEAAPDVLVVRSTKVGAAALDASPRLALIVRAGAGYDTIDVAGASDRGIFVANCPGQNAVAVAELTLGLLVALDRQLPDNVIDARAGRWNKKAYAQADGLKGRTLGVVGVGHIGEAVIRRAQACEMEVVAWSRSLTDARAEALGVVRCETPAAVAARADAVTLHVAATPATRHLADRAFFEALREGAFFLNTTRASVVDEDALAWALEAKGLRAALDVVTGEPAAKEAAFAHPLAQHPRVYLTHHIGASTQQAQDATAEEAARVVLAFDATGDVPNCVNLAAQTEATHVLTVRHRDQVGVLAGVLDAVRRLEWNVQEMDNRIFAGGEAAVATLRIDGDPTTGDALPEIEGCDGVLAVSVSAL